MFHLLIVVVFFFVVVFIIIFFFFYSAVLRDSFSSRKEHTQCEREKVNLSSKTSSGNINHVINEKKCTSFNLFIYTFYTTVVITLGVFLVVSFFLSFGASNESVLNMFRMVCVSVCVAKVCMCACVYTCLGCCFCLVFFSISECVHLVHSFALVYVTTSSVVDLYQKPKTLQSVLVSLVLRFG